MAPALLPAKNGIRLQKKNISEIEADIGLSAGVIYFVL